MKTMKKVFAVVLVGAMGLSLAACGGKKAKQLTAKEFKKVMKAEDYSVSEGNDDDYEEYLIAVDEDKEIQVNYYLFEVYGGGEKGRVINKSSRSEWKDEYDMDGSVKKSGNKFVADLSGEDDDGDEGGIYLVCVRSGEMVITATTYEVDKSTKKKVDSIIDTLCY